MISLEYDINVNATFGSSNLNAGNVTVIAVLFSFFSPIIVQSSNAGPISRLDTWIRRVDMIGVNFTILTTATKKEVWF